VQKLIEMPDNSALILRREYYSPAASDSRCGGHANVLVADSASDDGASRRRRPTGVVGSPEQSPARRKKAEKPAGRPTEQGIGSIEDRETKDKGFRFQGFKVSSFKVARLQVSSFNQDLSS